MNNETKVITESNMIMVIEENKQEAERIILDEDKFEKLIQKVEKIINDFPVIGKYLSEIVCMVSLVRNYMKKEYTDVPIRTITSIVAALMYVAAPIDLIADAIPIVGLLDDAAVLAWVIKSIDTDIEKYRKWRIDNNIQIEEHL